MITESTDMGVQDEENILVPRINKSLSENNHEQSQKYDYFAWPDLVKFIQITLILILIMFILGMVVIIVQQIQILWISPLPQEKTNIQELSKIDVKVEEIQQKSHDMIQPQKPVQLIAQDQKNHYKLEENFNKDIHKQAKIQQIKIENIQPHQQQKQSIGLIKRQPQPPLNNPPNLPVSQNNYPTKLSFIQQQKKIIQFTELGDIKQDQIFDPVLVQLQKTRKRYGKSYKQTIYTSTNTSISYSQYERAKNLTQIMNYYKAKQNKFIVNTNNQNTQCFIKKRSCSQIQQQIDSQVKQQVQYYETKYGQYFIQLKKQLPFCIIVPSYMNNKNNNYFKNLNSIFQQQYQNFHVIYIDDASTDGTSQSVRRYIQTNEIKQTKIKLIQNQQNQKALKNIYLAAHNYCNQKEIMIIIDGDDYLIGTQVFRFFNYQYQTKKLLAAYTNYLRINQPYYVKVGTSCPYTETVIKRRMFRNYANMFKASHLRSYYVDLFRKIKPQDLKDKDGNFFTAANDFAIMMPILQMASPHIKYLPELTYLYDSGTGLNNFQSKKQMQARNVQTVARRPKYGPIQNEEFYKTQKS